MAPLRFESPVPALNAAWGRASPLLLERVAAFRAGFRQGMVALDRPALTAWSWMAHALLVAGEREPARDISHLLARGVERGSLSPEAAAALPVLLARLEAWTGDAEWTGRYALALGLVRPEGGAPGAAASRLGELLDSAGPSWSADDTVGRAAGLIHGVVYGMWGVAPDATAARLRLAPRLPGGWNGSALLGLRVGATTVDLALRVRPAALVLRVSRVHGPPIGIAAEPPGPGWEAGAMVDDQALGTSAVRFEAHADHEVVWPISRD